jgi:hypothetical protein
MEFPTSQSLDKTASSVLLMMLNQPFVDGSGESLLPTSTNEYFRPGQPDFSEADVRLRSRGY